MPHALAASVKRYKTSEMLRFIFATIAYDPDPDLTPLTVRRLCKALFGRTGSQWLVVEVFGGEGASAPQRGQQSGDGGKKWLPDIVMPPNYTGPQRWQKLNG